MYCAGDALRYPGRYHVAGGKGAFYARAPYMNKDLGAGAHATRFIGLAPVGNAAKQKFLHALALVPAVDMDQKALTVRHDAAGRPSLIFCAGIARSSNG